VPTSRARLTITETDDVARMLDEAAERWPEDRVHRARLLKPAGGSLRARTRLKLPDCCVIMAAEIAAGTILTFDERLAAAARRLGVGIEPPWVGVSDLRS
jgi:hypothetical protein